MKKIDLRSVKDQERSIIRRDAIKMINRGDKKKDIATFYGVHVNSEGVNTWEANGMPIANSNNPESGHTFWEDDHGGAVLGYIDSNDTWLGV